MKKNSKDTAIRVIIILLLALPLSGCRNKELKMTQEELQKHMVETGTLFSEYPKALEMGYENFVLPLEVTIDDGSLCSQIHFAQASGFDVNAEAVFQLFLQDYFTENIKMTSESNEYHEYKQIADDKNEIYGVVRDDGFVSVIKPAGWETQFFNDFVVADVIHVDRGEPLSDSYLLADGQESLQDAVNYVNNWLNQYWSVWEPDFTYRVKTIEIRETGDHYFYDMSIEKVYEGIPLDDIMNARDITTDQNGNMLLKYTMNGIKIRMCTCDSIDVFSNATGILKLQDKEQAEEGWLSLADCMAMLEQLFSEYTVYKVSDVEMKYVLCPDYTSVSDQKVKFDFHTPGMEIEAIPVWSLIIDVDKEKLLNEDGTFTAGYVREFINVNMRTGEVWFDLEQGRE